MPYIENDEEKQRREEWKAKQQSKNNKLDAHYEMLTRKQQEALTEMWKAYDAWDRQTSEEWLLYDTYIRLKNVRSVFYQAFPCVTHEEDDDE